MITLADVQAAAPRVLGRLQDLSPLPEHGTVAGQAVASMFYEELGLQVRGRVHDIDVFVNSCMPRTMRGLEELPAEYAPGNGQSRRPSQSTVDHANRASSESDSYQHVKFIALRSSTKILRTYRAGLVNYTLVQSSGVPQGEISHDASVSQTIVNGFDLNVVGVGINLTNGAVVCSPGFLEFLNDLTMRVETCSTPAHTLVRLAKKWHGGEVTGAVCDYDGERMMLEAALQCQRQDVDPADRKAYDDAIASSDILRHSDALGFRSIIEFGAKYKSLQEQWAHCLPAIQSRMVTDESGLVYEMSSFSGLTSHPDNEILMHHDARRIYCTAATAYGSMFPQIYGLFHPERCRLDEEERLKRQEEFLLIAKDKSDAHNLNCLQRALGRVVVDFPVPDMDEFDTSVFFLNQDCTADSSMALKAIEVFGGMGEIERLVMARNDWKADDVLAWDSDRPGVLKKLLLEHGADFFMQICQYRTQNDTGDTKKQIITQALAVLEQHVSMEADGLLGKSVLDRGKNEVVFAWNGVTKNLLFRGSDPNSSETLFKPFGEIVRQWDEPERSAMGQRLLRLVIPHWPSLTGLAHQDRYDAITHIMAAELDVPESIWAQLQGNMGECLRAISGNLPFLTTGRWSLSDNPKAQKILARMLDGVSDDTLFLEGNGAAVQACLAHEDVHHLICDRLGRMEPGSVGDGYLNDIRQTIIMSVEKNKNRSFGLFSGPEDGRFHLRNAPKALAVLDLVTISRAIGPTDAPRKPRRL